jgi:type II secretory ATPase GspE/PulE/Tfp pilus assembly ATPase PilB-like protein
MGNGKESPGPDAVSIVDDLLRRAILRQSSDVHFEPDEGFMRVRYRMDGLLHDVDRLPGSVSENIVARLKVLSGLLTYRTDVPQEGSFAANGCAPAGMPPVDVRVATFPTVRGERVAVRFMYADVRVTSLDGLGLRPDMVAGLRKAVERPGGLILVTGPAGSGKSTTLYALARHILAVTPGRSVVSLEDPVEQRVAGMAQIQVSPHGELDYLRAMRSLLRQDVQVLLVGEIRDAETAHVVVEASLTGHLILSTMHSGDPAEAIARLLEMGIAPYQLVSALSVVSSQRLLRTVCTTCGNKGGTCEACAGTGYRGRTACGQIAVIDEPLRQAILQRTAAGELRRQILKNGPDLIADARRLEREARTTQDEILRVFGALE